MESLVEYKYNNILDAIQYKMNSNSTTNTNQLLMWGFILFDVERFIGVFARNTIPTMRNGESCIVNTDVSSGMGVHWVAVIRHDFKYIIYDSFGRKHVTLDLKNILLPDADSEQGKIETNCGQRCLAFIQLYYDYGWDYCKYL